MVWVRMGVESGDKTGETCWGQSERLSGSLKKFGPQPGGL